MRFVLICALLGVFQASAQTHIPNWSDAFLQEEIAVIRIEIDPDSLDFALALADPTNEHEYPASFIYESSVRTDTLMNVGFRLRGSSSLNAIKKSFKLSVNSFTPGAKWLGLEKLNLVAQHNDPSLLRAKLCWDGIRHFGLAGSRTSFVKVYINNEFKGLYLNVEHIDENFANTYFLDSSAPLWKCTYPADLAYLGSNPELYKFEMWGRRMYELKTNTFQDDYRPLAEFVDVLNNTPLATLPCALERLFNVDDYLKYLALDVLTGNWDNYVYNKNNFYLCRNEQTGLIDYIPYDLDNTLGLDWVNVDWTERNVYNWSPSNEERPLYDRLMLIPEYRNQFTYYLESFAADWFTEEGIIAHAVQLHELITPAALEDPYRPLDFDYSEDDFLNSIVEAAGEQVSFGIAEFVQLRVNEMNSQTEAFVSPAVMHNLTAVIVSNSVVIRAVASPGTSFLAVWREWPDGNWSAEPMALDFPSAPWNEISILAAITPISPTSTIEYNVLSNDEWLADQNGGCPTRFIHREWSSSGLTINELQSGGNPLITDEFGEADDWIELYNGGGSAIYLGDKFITDGPNNWNKWRMPNITLEPGNFLLLWADDDPEQGVFHLGFKLNVMGESVQLTEVVQRAPKVIDRIAVPELTEGASLGREVDGLTPWIFFDVPTPNMSNQFVSVSNHTEVDFSIYPNPSSGLIQFSKPITGEILDLSGRKACSFPTTTSLDLTGLSSGVYMLRSGTIALRFIIR